MVVSILTVEDAELIMQEINLMKGKVAQLEKDFADLVKDLQEQMEKKQ